MYVHSVLFSWRALVHKHKLHSGSCELLLDLTTHKAISIIILGTFLSSLISYFLNWMLINMPLCVCITTKVLGSWSEKEGRRRKNSLVGGHLQVYLDPISHRWFPSTLWGNCLYYLFLHDNYDVNMIRLHCRLARPYCWATLAATSLLMNPLIKILWMPTFWLQVKYEILWVSDAPLSNSQGLAL